MNPYTASALITGGASLGASGINAGLGLLSSSLQHDRNKELMELENKYNLMQWHRENEYNLPVNQVQRLKAAGLNPALMYGNGADGLTAASGNGVSGQSAGMPDLGQVDPLTAAKIANINAETRKTEADTDLSIANTEESKQRVLNLRQEIRQSEQDINESAARIRNLDENTKKQAAEQVKMEFDKRMRSKEWRDSHNLINKQLEEIDSRIKLNDREYKELVATFVYRLSGMRLDNQLKEKELAKYDKVLEMLGVEITAAKQNLVINMPAFYQGNAVMDMKNGNSVPSRVASTMYDGLSLFTSLCRGIFSVGLH